MAGYSTTKRKAQSLEDLGLTGYSNTLKVNDVISKGPMVDVRAFGAKGDKITDDTAAIQAAINASYGIPSFAGEQTGKTIYFPIGVYMISSPLVVPANAGISFVGEGKTKSNIYQSVANTDILQMSGNNYRGVIKGLRLEGPIGQVSGAGAAINITGSGNQIYVEDCWIGGMGYGIKGNPTSDSNFINNVFEFVHRAIALYNGNDFYIGHNVFYDCGPVSCGGSEQAATIILSSCVRAFIQGNRVVNDAAMSPQSGGYYQFGSCTSITMSDEIMNASTTLNANLVYIEACSDIRIHHCTFGKSSLSSILLVGTNKGINIDSNYFFGCSSGSYKTITAASGSFSDIKIINNSFDVGTLAGYDLYADTGSDLLISKNFFTKGYLVDVGCKAFVLPDNIGGVSRSFLNAAPIYNTWSVGDKVYVSSPSAGGYTGYVCVVAGSPGTWKGFGLIQA